MATRKRPLSSTDGSRNIHNNNGHFNARYRRRRTPIMLCIRHPPGALGDLGIAISPEDATLPTQPMGDTGSPSDEPSPAATDSKRILRNREVSLQLPQRPMSETPIRRERGAEVSSNFDSAIVPSARYQELVRESLAALVPTPQELMLAEKKLWNLRHRYRPEGSISPFAMQMTHLQELAEKRKAALPATEGYGGSAWVEGSDVVSMAIDPVPNRGSDNDIMPSVVGGGSEEAAHVRLNRSSQSQIPTHMEPGAQPAQNQTQQHLPGRASGGKRLTADGEPTFETKNRSKEVMASLLQGLVLPKPEDEEPEGGEGKSDTPPVPTTKRPEQPIPSKGKSGRQPVKTVEASRQPQLGKVTGAPELAIPKPAPAGRKKARAPTLLAGADVGITPGTKRRATRAPPKQASSETVKPRRPVKPSAPGRGRKLRTNPAPSGQPRRTAPGPATPVQTAPPETPSQGPGGLDRDRSKPRVSRNGPKRSGQRRPSPIRSDLYPDGTPRPGFTVWNPTHPLWPGTPPRAGNSGLLASRPAVPGGADHMQLNAHGNVIFGIPPGPMPGYVGTGGGYNYHPGHVPVPGTGSPLPPMIHSSSSGLFTFGSMVPRTENSPGMQLYHHAPNSAPIAPMAHMAPRNFPAMSMVPGNFPTVPGNFQARSMIPQSFPAAPGNYPAMSMVPGSSPTVPGNYPAIHMDAPMVTFPPIHMVQGNFPAAPMSSGIVQPQVGPGSSPGFGTPPGTPIFQTTSLAMDFEQASKEFPNAS
ncbi:hypothetical protein FN846DRAFT_1019401 [Sphaerosporella brunnea]|uniref:Uncharacterized protein n=1 Tax=Sphaerosporella brunnea TaxID=1250544 RepID=A0A5J5F6A1_9PEZI|nr:hypothetical protein FN846DRAFT_1019401 [Sphaerosporella brunnea]